jgi:hypothetical protein
MLNRVVAVQLAATAMVLVGGVEAFAQSGGLFGATRDDTADRDRLNVAAVVGAAFDTELPPFVQAQTTQVTPQSGGFSTMAVGTAQYAHTRRRARIAATGQSAFRYFGELDRVDALGQSAGIGADIRLTRLASLRIDQSAAYTPSYLYNLIPSSTPPALGDTIETAPNFQVVHDDSYSYRSAISLSIGGTGRGPSLQIGGGYDRTRYLTERLDRSRLTTHYGRLTFTQHLRRNLGLSGESEYRTGTYGLGLSNEHRITGGIDYTRRLSSTRDAKFRVNIGRSMLEMPFVTAEGEVDDQVERTFADASVAIELKRNWDVTGSVRRNIEYTPLFREPLLSQGASVSLTGLLTRRIDFSGTVGYADGTAALNQGNTIKTYTGDARARFALTRSVGLFAQYVYIHYDMRSRELLLIPNLPEAFHQHGIRIGLALWASAF